MHTNTNTSYTAARKPQQTDPGVLRQKLPTPTHVTPCSSPTHLLAPVDYCATTVQQAQTMPDHPQQHTQLWGRHHAHAHTSSTRTCHRRKQCRRMYTQPQCTSVAVIYSKKVPVLSSVHVHSPPSRRMLSHTHTSNNNKKGDTLQHHRWCVGTNNASLQVATRWCFVCKVAQPHHQHQHLALLDARHTCMRAKRVQPHAHADWR